MRFDVLTLFPDMVRNMQEGVTGRAISKDIVEMHLWNPRDYTDDVHNTVDDRPYGGGPGMVMKYQPLQKTIRDIKMQAPDSSVLYMSPQGKPFKQKDAERLSDSKGLVFVCGRYEGIDERFLSQYVDEEYSIGDYVLSGGELAAQVMMDAIIRLLPGVLGHKLSAEQDSFSAGLLDCPHYTRPEVVDGLAVPEVLRSGDHQRIHRWRLQQALGQTWLKRPDLLENRVLTAEEDTLLKAFKEAHREDAQE